MEVLSWKDVAQEAKKRGVPSTLINWFHAVFDPGASAPKHWSKTKQFGKWDVQYRSTRLFKTELNQPIRRTHLASGDKIPISLPSLEEYDYFPVVRNMVATCRWIPLSDLSRIAHFLPNVELLSNYASAINLRIGKVMCRLFTTGVIVLTTCQTVEQAKFETHQCRMIFERIPVPMLVYNAEKPHAMPTLQLTTLELFSMLTRFNIVNVVASGVASERPLDIMEIVHQYSKIGKAIWAPELFPGANLTIEPSEECPLQGKNVTIRLFDTGRTMATGFHLNDIKLAHRYIRNWVKPYIDENLPINPMNRFKYRLMKLLSHNQNNSVPLPAVDDDGDDDGGQPSSGRIVAETQQHILDILDTLPSSTVPHMSSLTSSRLPSLPQMNMQPIRTPLLAIQPNHEMGDINENLIQDQFDESKIQEYLDQLIQSETFGFSGSITWGVNRKKGVKK